MRTHIHRLVVGLACVDGSHAEVAVIAHRGNSDFAPENMIAAFASAFGKTNTSNPPYWATARSASQCQ